MLIDPISGLDTSNDVKANIYKNAREHSPSVLVEADFFNLGECNNALGRPMTNELFRLFTTVYLTELEKLGASYVYGWRNGGDELTFILANVAPDKVEKAIASAKREIQSFADQTSLNLLQHPKRPHQAGFGLDAIVGAITADSELSAHGGTLQNRLLDNKKLDQGRTRETFVPASYFGSNSKRQDIEDTLAIWKAKYPARNIILPPGMDKDDPNGLSLQGRRNRQISEVSSSGKYSLLRIDLLNMATLNDRIGKNVTDRILAQLEKIIMTQCGANKLPYDFYNIGGGIFDVVIQSQNRASLDALKKCIYLDANQTIFSKTVGAYIKKADQIGESEVDADVVQTRISDLEDIRSKEKGVGLVMDHAPVSGKEPSELFQYIDDKIGLLKLHRLSFVEADPPKFPESPLHHPANIFRRVAGIFRRKSAEIEKRSEGLYRLYPLQSPNTPRDVPNVDPVVEKPFPYAASLRNDLSGEQLLVILSSGPERVKQYLDGVQPDQDVGDKPGDYAAGPDIAIPINHALSALRLARQYSRAYENGSELINENDSKAFLLGDIDIRQASECLYENTSELSLMAQCANISVHAANLLGTNVSPRVKDIVAALAAQSLNSLAGNIRRPPGDPQMADIFDALAAQMSKESGGNSLLEGTRFLLFREIERQRLQLIESEKFTDEEKRQLNEKLSLVNEAPGDRKELEVLAERHKVWLETNGRCGEQLILENARIKTALIVQEMYRKDRGHNSDVYFDFSKSVIVDSRLTKMDFGNSKFDDAVVRNVDFDCGMMDEADFRHVKELADTSFAFCQINGAKFTLSKDLMSCSFFQNPLEVDVQEYFRNNAFYTPIRNIEFYTPDGLRVYGFNFGEEGQLHFKPDSRDALANRMSGVKDSEVRDLIGDRLLLRERREEYRRQCVQTSPTP